MASPDIPEAGVQWIRQDGLPTRYFFKLILDIWRCVAITSSSQTGTEYTTGDSGHEIVIWKNTSAAVGKLNANPKDGDMVTFKRTKEAVTMDGNGNKIDGETDILLGATYDAPTVIYTDAAGEWSLVMSYFGFKRDEVTGEIHVSDGGTGKWTEYIARHMAIQTAMFQQCFEIDPELLDIEVTEDGD